MITTADYLNTKESFIDLVINDFSSGKTKIHSRIYTILVNKEYTFNSFVKDVLSYKSPYHYMMRQRNAGKVVAELFAQEFNKYVTTYSSTRISSTSSISTTFSGSYTYVY